MSPGDRTAIDAVLARYGSAWADGLAGLERDFLVAVTGRWRLTLTSRVAPRITYRLIIDEQAGLSGEVPELPPALELSPEQLARFDELLRREGTLWWVEPLNDHLVVSDVSAGLAAFPRQPPEPEQSGSWGRLDLTGMRLQATRLVDDLAVLYLQSRPFGHYLCLCADPAGNALEGIYACDSMPPRSRRLHLLSAQRRDFFDRALRDHGDFGVYGNVTAGLALLHHELDIQLRDLGSAWSFSMTPRDGDGHFLQFEVNKQSGAIDGCMAGHLDPPPSGDD